MKTGTYNFKFITRSALLVLALISLPYAVSRSEAADFDGLWATNPDACKDIFIKRGNEIAFSDKADMYGSGFIVSGKTIRGKIAVCKIQSMRKNGNAANIRAACATDISVSTNNFGLRLVEDNKLVRSIPGVPELDTSYFRCP